MNYLVCYLLILLVYRVWNAGTRPAHEECQQCGLWIGDPPHGEPRICPVCETPMLAAGSTLRQTWDWRKL